MIWLRRRSDHPNEDDLSAHLDGELGRRAEAIQAHIEGCGACRGRLDELRLVKAALAELPRPVTARSFVVSAEEAGRVVARPTGRRPSFAFAPAAALSLLVALLFVDVAVLSDGATRSDELAAGADQGAAAALEKATEPGEAEPGEAQSRASEPGTAEPPAEQRGAEPPAVAPQAAAAEAGAVTQAADASDGATETDNAARTPAEEPQAFDDGQPVERQPAPAPQVDADSGARDAVRLLEVATAIALLVTLLVFLRQRLSRGGGR